jgi:hypothetical protein
VVDLEDRLDGRALDFADGLAHEVGDRQQVIALQEFRLHPKEIRIQAGRGDAAAFAISAIAHLLECLEQRAAGYRDAGSQADHAAAALALGFPKRRRDRTKPRTRSDEGVSEARQGDPSGSTRRR